MKFGTKITLADGREATVVYNGLDGVGIKWGHYNLSEEDCRGDGVFNREGKPWDYKWSAEAMLREPYPSAEMECVGSDFEIAS